MSASGNEPIISILHHHRLSWDKTSSLHQPLAELHFSRLFAAAIVASVPLIPPSSSWPRSSWFTGFHAGAEGFLYGCNLKNAIRIICSCCPLQVFKDLRGNINILSDFWSMPALELRGVWSANEPEPWMDAAARNGAQRRQHTRPFASSWTDRSRFQVVDRWGLEGCRPLQPVKSRV